MCPPCVHPVIGTTLGSRTISFSKNLAISRTALSGYPKALATSAVAEGPLRPQTLSNTAWALATLEMLEASRGDG